MHLSHDLVLASSSQIRERLLNELGIPFTVIQPKFDEEAAKKTIQHLSPKDKSRELAKGKAASVNAIHPDWLVIGADQICECEGEILSKPGTIENASQSLKKLRNKTHSQHSAICLYHQGKCIWETVETAQLTMRNLKDTEIKAYLQMDHPIHSCGAYRLEAHGKHLFSKISGGDDVIMGLPTTALLAALYEYNYLTLVA